MAESLRARYRRAQPATGRGLYALLLATVVVFLLLPVCTPSFAADEGEARAKAAQLEQLRKRIGKLKGQLQEARGTRDRTQAALEKTDKAISGIIATLRNTRARVRQATQELDTLEKEQRAQQRKLAETQALLVKEVRASYMAGRQQHIKLLLNQQEPAAVGRMLAYQGYFTRARTSHMRDYERIAARLRDTQQSLSEKRSGLVRLQREEQAQADSLGAEQLRQREVLARIDRQLGDKSAELETLQQDEQRLGKLVESLRRALANIPLGELDRPLKSLKGKLGWPVSGRIMQHYGARQGSGKIRSRGVLIATRADTDVHAIAKGRVAFADWLRGFGLLLILDHGDGYMSLYGHNNSLYKAVGEWVERGEVVAAAGSSGGRQRSGLYLELRRNGRPVDPGAWFRGKPRAQTAKR